MWGGRLRVVFRSHVLCVCVVRPLPQKQLSNKAFWAQARGGVPQIPHGHSHGPSASAGGHSHGPVPHGHSHGGVPCHGH